MSAHIRLPATASASASAPAPGDVPSIDWSPLVPGGSNFRTHRVRAVDGEHIRVVPTLQFLAFNGLFLFAGLSLLGQAIPRGAPRPARPGSSVSSASSSSASQRGCCAVSAGR